MPFGNLMYLLKLLGSCSSRICMIMRVDIQNPRNDGFYFFLHLQEGDALWKKNIYISKYPRSCSFRIYMGIWAFLQNPRSGCLFYLNLQEGGALRIHYMTFRYISFWSQGPQDSSDIFTFKIGLIVKEEFEFFWTFRREVPLGFTMKNIYISKYRGSYRFRIYIVIWAFLQSPRRGCLFSWTFRREVPLGFTKRPSDIYYSGAKVIRIPTISLPSKSDL